MFTIPLFILYAALVGLIYDILPLSLSILIFFLSAVLYCYKSTLHTISLPFILYPAMFVIRAREPDNLILVLMPDFALLISIICMLARIRFELKDNLFHALVLYMCLHFFILASHTNELYFYPAIFRQYVMPLIFLIFIIGYSRENMRVISYTGKLFFISTTLVIFSSILNYFDLLNVNPSFPDLYPYTAYLLEVEKVRKVGRYLTRDIFLPRLNLFLGGGGGSSAALITALSFVYFSNKFLSFLAFIILIIGAILTLSYSVLIPIFIGLAIYTVQLPLKYRIFGVLALLCFVTVGANIEFIIDLSVLDYFNNSIFTDLISHFRDISVMEFLFGVGPKLTATGFEFMPNKFLIDIGIIRILLESGIFTFLIFLFILAVILKKAFHLVLNGDLLAGRFLVFFCTSILVVHGNYTILPPFYLFFALSVAYLINSKNTILNMPR